MSRHGLERLSHLAQGEAKAKSIVLYAWYRVGERRNVSVQNQEGLQHGKSAGCD